MEELHTGDALEGSLVLLTVKSSAYWIRELSGVRSGAFILDSYRVHCGVGVGGVEKRTELGAVKSWSYVSFLRSNKDHMQKEKRLFIKL